MADEGKIVKMEVDYTKDVDEKIPQAEKLSKEGKLEEGLEMLMGMEKQSRVAADMHSTSRVLVAIVKLCWDAKKYALLNENIILLTKRRSQLKQAVTKMVQECCTYVDEIADKETKLKLIDTLRTVTAGKIYVENERARLTLKLSKIKESDGDVAEAATVLQELQVETFGSMERKEKVEFILEQIRLCLARNDYIRTQIISKKINTKFFDDAEVSDLKLKYYEMMIQLGVHDKAYLAVCKHYRAVYDTPVIQESKDRWQEALKCVVLYVILAAYDNEQSDLIHRIKLDKKLEDLTSYKQLLENFTTSEIMRWHKLRELYGQELRQGTEQSPAPNVFGDTEMGNKRWDDLKNRVVEHNIRVLAKYYTKLRLSRMAELLDLSVEEAEKVLCNLVSSGTVEAKTDRLEGVVSFSRPKNPAGVLNDWSNNLTSLMKLVNKTTHLINKEQMVHQLN